MFPEIHILNKTIHAYMIMSLIGILVSLFYVINKCKKEKISDYDYIIVLLFGALGAIIGGHLLYGIVNYKLIIYFFNNLEKVTNVNILLQYLILIFGGNVFYGGLIGGLIASYITIKIRKMNIKRTTDFLTPVIPLFHFFGRIGCFLSGCCYGVKSHIGFTYKYSLIESANNVNRFPIQLVESFYNLILFILLTIFYKKNKMKGKILYLYLVLYSIGRFIFEFFRGDEYRGFVLGLSTSQFISIIIFVISIILISRKEVQNGKERRTKSRRNKN